MERCMALVVMLAGLAAMGGAAPADDVYTDNAVIILDSSGSMGDRMRGSNVQKMAAAKTALIAALKQVPGTVQIGLLVFSGRGGDLNWLYPLGRRDDARLIKAINRPQPGGDTPLGQYIKIGADRLLEERRKQHGYGTYRLLIVTDGEATDGNLTDVYVPEVLARGITIDVIGVDMSRAHALATSVHSYRSADDPSSLQKALVEVFAEVSSTGADAAIGADAFELISPLPDKAAAGMLEALGRSGDHPIGEKPNVATQQQNVAAPTPGSADQAAPMQPPPSMPRQSKPVSGLMIIVAVVLALLFIRSLVKHMTRR